ncbi:hypothetical protein [Endozoicomonas euniceicola]|uniref:Uncharacterized protein n=1 Tax=Endozoicomonas euniceicola TaxID=1234143 RepID=A0ABY6GXT8_9GAMM|nr:hypothetical protein [Endozoicomonas euniceicola]UYM17613.1 hypothetical protein NX720_06825 [Endozoicomonas euniceicola]
MQIEQKATVREAAEHNIPLLAVGCWLLAVGCWLLAFGFWLLAFGFWRLAVGGWLYEQLIAKSQQPGKLLNAAPLTSFVP